MEKLRVYLITFRKFSVFFWEEDNREENEILTEICTISVSYFLNYWHVNINFYSLE